MSISIDKNKALIALSDSDSGRFWKDAFETLTEQERIFRAIWEIEAEVNNGGFHQYFFNDSGDHAATGASSLAEIGAEKAADIARRAIAVFGASGPANDRTERQEQLEALTDDQVAALEELDSEFYRDPDNLTELLYQFVSAHRESIRGAGNMPWG